MTATREPVVNYLRGAEALGRPPIPIDGRSEPCVCGEVITLPLDERTWGAGLREHYHGIRHRAYESAAARRGG